jgi:hypothetical protein
VSLYGDVQVLGYYPLSPLLNVVITVFGLCSGDSSGCSSDDGGSMSNCAFLSKGLSVISRRTDERSDDGLGL